MRIWREVLTRTFVVLLVVGVLTLAGLFGMWLAYLMNVGLVAPP
jgi:hypothetical protein